MGRQVAEGAQAPAAPWTPPKTKLPSSFVKAVAFAFDHGLPDPRGGEFREVTIRGGALWGFSNTEATVTGWVMPAAADVSQIAICWNGLPYRPLKIGQKRDLAAFIKEKSAKRPPAGAAQRAPRRQ